eukprot:364357-Chlamydomonas_euryale.AAC.6
MVGVGIGNQLLPYTFHNIGVMNAHTFNAASLQASLMSVCTPSLSLSVDLEQYVQAGKGGGDLDIIVVFDAPFLDSRCGVSGRRHRIAMLILRGLVHDLRGRLDRVLASGPPLLATPHTFMLASASSPPPPPRRLALPPRNDPRRKSSRRGPSRAGGASRGRPARATREVWGAAASRAVGDSQRRPLGRCMPIGVDPPLDAPGSAAGAARTARDRQAAAAAGAGAGAAAPAPRHQQRQLNHAGPASSGVMDSQRRVGGGGVTRESASAAAAATREN